MNSTFEGVGSLRDRFGLAQGDDDVAVAIARRSAGGPTMILPEEEAVILAARPEDEHVPRPDSVRHAMELFSQIGAAWPGALEAARRQRG